MKSKKRVSVSDEMPNERPAKWVPDSLKGLRWERWKLRQISKALAAKDVAFHNDADSPRRLAICALLEIATHPKRRKFDADLLEAAKFLSEYHDALVILILDLAIGYYTNWIVEKKASRTK